MTLLSYSNLPGLVPTYTVAHGLYLLPDITSTKDMGRPTRDNSEAIQSEVANVCHLLLQEPSGTCLLLHSSPNLSSEQTCQWLHQTQ